MFVRHVFSALSTALALLLPNSCVAQDLQATPASLTAFLDRYLATERSTQISAARVQLTDKCGEHFLVYVSGRQWCGTGGCLLLVLAGVDQSYTVLGRITNTRPPVRVLSHMTNGYHDIAVRVAGGGVHIGYEAVLTFDGKKYPGNPTMPPAIKPAEEPPGDVVFPEPRSEPTPDN
ncbi:MAG: hypothetical protein KBD01_01155 [Acidobacteria bacterium]|nr:hypothetical protein [Acidobacteriota bacterium]